MTAERRMICFDDGPRRFQVRAAGDAELEFRWVDGDAASLASAPFYAAVMQPHLLPLPATALHLVDIETVVA